MFSVVAAIALDVLSIVKPSGWIQPTLHLDASCNPRSLLQLW